MTTIRVIAAVLDTEQLTLYKQDGETVSIPQGDHRVRKIIDSIAMDIVTKGFSEVDVGMVAPSHYAAFEQKTNGLVKFFRVAKKAVQHLLGADEDRAEPVAPTTIGTVPGEKYTGKKANLVIADEIHRDPDPRPLPESISKAIDEIMTHAEPVSSSTYNDKGTTPDQTMVAVVGSGKNTKIVPGVEALHDQFKHAAKLGSTKGMENLISRLGAIIAAGKRGHSVQDVLRFLEKGDLPIADDGSIIAYKILRRHTSEEATFVDCHTRKIPQRVGDYVCVAENLVDRNRRNECSNGLHIARRGYIRSFSGDVCVLTKIDPEDVVTVPHGDPNKVRVCGYHIIGLISHADYQKLINDQPMTDSDEARKLLAQAISGQHIGRIRQVMVTEQQGNGVKITAMGQAQAKLAKPTQEAKAAAVALDDKTLSTKDTVDPKAVAKQVTDQKANPTKASADAFFKGPPSRKDKAQELYLKGDLEALKLLKKQSKVSWSALGFDIRAIETIEAGVPIVPPAVYPTPKPAPVAKEPFGRKADAKTAAEARKAAEKTVNDILGAPVQAVDLDKALPSPSKVATSGPRQLKALELLNRTRNLDLKPSERWTAAVELVAFKKTSKVSWEALCINQQSADSVIGLANRPKVTDPVPKPAKTETIATADMNPAKGGRPSISHTVKKTPTTNQGTKKMEGNRVEVARKLFDLALADRKQWPALWVHKRTAKQSWEALGFSKDEIRRINNSKPDHV